MPRSLSSLPHHRLMSNSSRDSMVSRRLATWARDGCRNGELKTRSEGTSPVSTPLLELVAIEAEVSPEKLAVRGACAVRQSERRCTSSRPCFDSGFRTTRLNDATFNFGSKPCAGPSSSHADLDLMAFEHDLSGTAEIDEGAQYRPSVSNSYLRCYARSVRYSLDTAPLSNKLGVGFEPALRRLIRMQDPHDMLSDGGDEICGQRRKC
ncbi:hypothetical protein FVE85_7436 [Porphyridium purpureum]|uniref:Uncharacterized protein n=1 Tax=Porphyridium purpureum TaxID=35688 RepID=A0A5J4Z7D1_PORPP|nr:hypothetical protein FVE85_7436 [Porphyridium purpureum]|eukprot:POR3267..scf295_1